MGIGEQYEFEKTGRIDPEPRMQAGVRIGGVLNGIHRSAEISDCGLYRWCLRRSWNRRHEGKGDCCFVMLNPSTADGLQDDPTIRRCIGFAQSWGYDSLIVRNLFPFRATNPKQLLNNRKDVVVGGIRGTRELRAALTASLVVVAWGASVPFGRDEEALSQFSRLCPAKPLHCLELTKHGKPRHPLYVKADKQPQLFRGPQERERVVE